VVQDQTPLRAAPQEAATRQATLWQGEWLEVRGERQGFLQVYDHRQERPGYVRQQQVRVYTLDYVLTAPTLSQTKRGLGRAFLVAARGLLEAATYSSAASAELAASGCTDVSFGRSTFVHLANAAERLPLLRTEVRVADWYSLPTRR
jgi:hypothetical protein